MEMCRRMVGKIHENYYSIEKTNLWHTSEIFCKDTNFK